MRDAGQRTDRGRVGKSPQTRRIFAVQVGTKPSTHPRARTTARFSPSTNAREVMSDGVAARSGVLLRPNTTEAEAPLVPTPRKNAVERRGGEEM